MFATDTLSQMADYNSRDSAAFAGFIQIHVCNMTLVLFNTVTTNK